jgi:hypothetical protein
MDFHIRDNTGEAEWTEYRRGSLLIIGKHDEE